MENNLFLKGMKNIDGMKFHDIEGGFGEGKKAMLVKEIANIHNKDLRVINQNIERNRKRFKDNIDIIDLKRTEFAVTLSDSGIYTQNSINASKNIYLLSERGYAKLLKILEDDVAWEQYDKLVDGYFTLRAKDKSGQANFTSQEDIMIYQLEEQKKIKRQLNEVNHRALATEENVERLEKDFINYKENECLSGVERDEITSLVKSIGVKSMGGKETKSYKNKSLRSRVYANIHKELRNQFDVPSYKYIKRKYFSKAKEVIYNYRLTIALREEIDLANSQVEFKELN